MGNNNIRAIVISEDHYNALGMVRSLGLANIEVFLILTTTMESYVDSSKFVFKAQKVNHTKEDIIAAIIDIVRDAEYRYVVFPLSDFTAFIVDEESGKFGDNVFVPHAQGKMRFFSDKFQIKKIIEECGITVPKGKIIDTRRVEISDWDIYPAIVKPLVSVEGAKGDIAIAEKEEDLRLIIQSYMKKGYLSALVEEYIDSNDAHMVEVMGARNLDGTVDFAGIIRKIREYPIKNGSTSYAKIVSSHEGIEFDKISLFLQKINFVGLFDVEFKYSNHKAYFIECNYRNGAPGFAFTLAGSNIPAKWICNNIEPVDYNEFPMERDFTFMVEQCDLINMLKGNPKFFTWLSQYFKSNKLFWLKKDNKPVKKYYVMFAMEIKQRLLRRKK